MRIMHVVGARPNFMKVAPVIAAFRSRQSVDQFLVHTGQHFDEHMSDVFFRELGLPQPDAHLHVGGGSHAEQTARIMLAFEPVLTDYRPDWLVVVGDVNSTLACALVASKLGVPIAHVEAGLRSGDMTMPEEINRRLTDAISHLLLIPSEDARANLRREGVPHERIAFVGNVMIDTLVQLLPLAQQRDVLKRLELKPHNFVLATLHRPSNVDSQEQLRELAAALKAISYICPVVFPVHPRTRQRLQLADIDLGPQVTLIPPLGYLDFLHAMSQAAVVITDSGGVQEETTYLGIPCLTVRPNTERPVTITHGTNRLVPPQCNALIDAFKLASTAPAHSRRVPPLWDGAAAERICDAILQA